MTCAIAGAKTAAALLAALALAGCAAPAPSPQERATAAQQAACRKRADEVFLQQNPNSVYSSDAYVASGRTAPFSASGIKGNTTAGLPERYTRDQIYQNCLNGIGPAAEPSPPTLTPPPATP